MAAYITIGALFSLQVIAGVYLLFTTTERRLVRQWWSGRPLALMRRNRNTGHDVWLRRIHRQSRAACRVYHVDVGWEAQQQWPRLQQTDRLAMAVYTGYDAAGILLALSALPVIVYDMVWLVTWGAGDDSPLPMTPAAGLGYLAVTIAFVAAALRWYPSRARRAEARAQQHLAFRTCTILLAQCWELRRRPDHASTEPLPLFGRPVGLDLNASVFLCELGEWAAWGYPTLNPARVREVREHVAGTQYAIHQALGGLLRAEPDALARLVTVLGHVQSGLYKGSWLRLLDNSMLPQETFELITRRRYQSKRRDAWIVLGAGVAVAGIWVGAEALGQTAAAGAMVTGLIGAMPLLFSTRRLNRDARSALASMAASGASSHNAP